MEYSPIPNALASKSLTLKMQRVQNRALWYAVKGTDDRHKTIEQLIKTWHKINEDLYDAMAEANNEDTRDHYWWPRVGRAYAGNPPEPMYMTL